MEAQRFDLGPESDRSDRKRQARNAKALAPRQALPLARTGHLTPELFEILNQSASHKWRDLTPTTQRSIEVLFAKNISTPEHFSNLVALFSATSQEDFKLPTTLFVGVSVQTPTMTIGTGAFLR